MEYYSSRGGVDKGGCLRVDESITQLGRGVSG